eukprot:gene10166-13674_t
MFSRLKEFDFYRRIPKDLTETTTHGSVLSICASIFMLILFVAELWAFLTYTVSTNIVIDPNTDSLLRINFNITVLDMPCEFAMIDVVDILGTRNDNVTKNINKWQVDQNGIRRNYEGRNVEQKDLLHDHDLDAEALHANGQHAVPMDEQNFDNWLQQHEYTLVNFYAPWCVWCQRLEPVYEAFAETVDHDQLPVSVIKVDCVNNRDLCMKQRIQAFPLLRWFKHGEGQLDYRGDRTIEALIDFSKSRLSLDEQVKNMDHHELAVHEERQAQMKDDHPGCMMAGFLLVNRVPGNFHIEARSKHHNLNPSVANLSHVVNQLSFGPLMSRSNIRKLESIPTKYFSLESTRPMNDQFYVNDKQHQAFHHYIKVVSTSVEVPRSESILAYQMVQSSQLMMYNEEDIPEARFEYDLSAMSVVVTRKGKQWYEFVTSICALIGGTFTVVGLLSNFLNIIFKPKKL